MSSESMVRRGGDKRVNERGVSRHLIASEVERVPDPSHAASGPIAPKHTSEPILFDRPLTDIHWT